MEQTIDLHTHSHYSDGDRSCSSLMKRAEENGTAVLSLTDHNGINGIDEAIECADEFGIHVVPGVEIYTRYRNQNLHLLGYCFELGDTELSRALRKLQEDNEHNVRQSIHSLQEQGFTLDETAIFNGPAVNRGVLHVIRELERYQKNIKKMQRELPPDKQDFFGKVKYFMGYDKPAALRVSELPTDEAIAIVRKSGGFAVLAHPGQQLNYDGDKLIRELIDAGLEGIEVLSPYHSWHQIEHYQSFALAHGLLITGGSDYHGDINFTKHEAIRCQWDYFSVPYSIYEKLKEQVPAI
ncbi:MAG: PHP domain-containing protein [Patescibacteria group bacterium]